MLGVFPLPVDLTTRAGEHSLAAGPSCCHFSCREIVFDIFPRDIPEPRWLQQARSEFNTSLAGNADARRRALLMCLHPRCAARGQFQCEALDALYTPVLCATGLQRHLACAKRLALHLIDMPSLGHLTLAA